MQPNLNDGQRAALSPAPVGPRRLYKSTTPKPAVPRQGNRHTRRRLSLSIKRTNGLCGASSAPKTAYFVYLLIGVHLSYAEAKRAIAGLDFAKRLPVTFERNENDMGKCKTWLAVSKPFNRRHWANVAQRQLALYAGPGAVSVRRGVVQ